MGAQKIWYKKIMEQFFCSVNIMFEKLIYLNLYYDIKSKSKIKKFKAIIIF